MTTLRESQQRLAYALVSQLLQYPDASLLERIPDLGLAASQLPEDVQVPLTTFVQHLALTDLLTLQRDYVDTFDLRRKCCLYLSYYLNGDTRRRGMALWMFKNAFATNGYEPASGELPDFLPTVLEFTALDEGVLGLALLTEHQQGLEVLRTALHERQSPYALLLDALQVALPRPTPEVLRAAAALAESGPPTEQVGLEPFFIPTPVVGARS